MTDLVVYVLTRSSTGKLRNMRHELAESDPLPRFDDEGSLVISDRVIYAAGAWRELSIRKNRTG